MVKRKLLLVLVLSRFRLYFLAASTSGAGSKLATTPLPDLYPDPRIKMPLFFGEMIVFGGSFLCVAVFDAAPTHPPAFPASGPDAPAQLLPNECVCFGYRASLILGPPRPHLP
jgi:hypothetical protein